MDNIKYDKELTIVIATHKKYRMPKDTCYLPVQVGALGKEDLGYIRDDIGQNISDKNSSFCELTALYWAWKNIDSKYLGLSHYRRHFSLRKKSKDPFENILSKKEALDILKNAEIIVPKRRNYIIESLESHYAHTHYISQLKETRKIIQEKYSEYIPDYDSVIDQKWGYMFNMMIADKKIISEYCEWLFDILFELEKRVNNGLVPDSQNLSFFQGRFYGRVSEIIFNVWLHYQLRVGKISKVKEINCINMEKINYRKKIIAFLSAKFLGKKYEGSF